MNGVSPSSSGNTTWQPASITSSPPTSRIPSTIEHRVQDCKCLSVESLAWVAGFVHGSWHGPPSGGLQSLLERVDRLVAALLRLFAFSGLGPQGRGLGRRLGCLGLLFRFDLGLG